MALQLRGKLGLGIVLIGGMLFIFGQQGVAEYQSTAGQASRMISDTSSNQYQQYALMRIGGGIAALVGGAMTVLDLAGEEQDRSPTNQLRDEVYSDRDIMTVGPGEYSYVRFVSEKDSILEYSAEVLEGNSINAIVTHEKHLEDFQKTSNIQ